MPRNARPLNMTNNGNKNSIGEALYQRKKLGGGIAAAKIKCLLTDTSAVRIQMYYVSMVF